MTPLSITDRSCPLTGNPRLLRTAARWVFASFIMLPLGNASAQETVPVPPKASSNAPAKTSPIVIAAGVVTLSEQVEVPAAEAGVIAELHVKPGQWVEIGNPLARLRDEDLRLLVERTRIQSQIARQEFENDLNELYAKKTTEVARAELERSLESNVKYAKTVSKTELDRQRLLVEQGELETRRAQHERLIAGLSGEVRENEHQTAKYQLETRQLIAPIKGMVVEVQRRLGEWVQPGDVVARIIRLDRLRVEGFLPARQGKIELVGRPVRVEATDDDNRPVQLSGEVVFVSPEIDPINSQVRVWVEVENTALQLRPGMTASVTVLAP